jgi:hypothetical protein
VSAIDDFLQDLDARLAAGALEHGDRSIAKPVSAILDELEQELIDLPGWSFILWAQACRKTTDRRNPTELRAQFLAQLRRRLLHNDRGTEVSATSGPLGCMNLIEILCLDFFEFSQRVRERLRPIARAIEVSQVMDPDQYRGRRGGMPPPRSSD